MADRAGGKSGHRLFKLRSLSTLVTLVLGYQVAAADVRGEPVIDRPLRIGLRRDRSSAEHRPISSAPTTRHPGSDFRSEGLLGGCSDRGRQSRSSHNKLKSLAALPERL